LGRVLYRALAELVLVLHAAFVAFAVLGGFLALRWRRVALLHVPATAWGAAIELTGGICPLTPLEDGLRIAGGGTGASGDFIERTIGSLIYVPGLHRCNQIALGAALLLLNAGVYGFMIYRSLGCRSRALKGGR